MRLNQEDDLWELDRLKSSAVIRLEYELEKTRKELEKTRDLVLELMGKNRELTNEE